MKTRTVAATLTQAAYFPHMLRDSKGENAEYSIDTAAVRVCDDHAELHLHGIGCCFRG
jgi:hypothetical protein